MGLSFLIVLGSLLSISRYSWLGMWRGLEINIICFLPIVIYFSRFLRIERIVKYFLVQSFGRVGILIGGLFQDFFIFYSFSFFFFFLFFSLFLKVGVFPFHWWVPSVINGISWFGVLLLSTWQKVAPVLIFAKFVNGRMLFLVFSSISSLIGGFIGICQVNIRFILAYSSISHAGWFFFLFCFSYFFGIIYFFMYLLVTFVLICFFWIFDYYRLSQIFFRSFIIVLFFFFCIITISGIPPFFGFFGKLIVFICFRVSYIRIVYLIFLILGSLFRLYFYLGIFFSIFFFYFNFLNYYRMKINRYLINLVLVSFFFSISFFFFDFFFL